jgi:hypothetical protein
MKNALIEVRYGHGIRVKLNEYATDQTMTILREMINNGIPILKGQFLADDEGSVYKIDWITYNMKGNTLIVNVYFEV